MVDVALALGFADARLRRGDGMRMEHAPRKHISTEWSTGFQDSGRGSARMNIFSNFFVTKSLLSPTDASQDQYYEHRATGSVVRA